MMASDGTNTTTIDCQNDGTWSEPAIDCDCKIFFDFELFEIQQKKYRYWNRGVACSLLGPLQVTQPITTFLILEILP